MSFPLKDELINDFRFEKRERYIKTLARALKWYAQYENKDPEDDEAATVLTEFLGELAVIETST